MNIRRVLCGMVSIGIIAFFAAPAKAQMESSSDLATATKELVALEDQLNAAFIQRDPGPLEHYLADEFVITQSDGQTLSKQRYLQWMKEAEIELLSITILDPLVMQLGDAAVLRGMINIKGKEFETVERFMDVWIQRDGRWQLAAGQNTPAEKEMPITTSSSKARELFIQGRDKLEYYDNASALRLFDQAIALDSTFVLAYVALSQLSQGGSESLVTNLTKARAHAGKITRGEQLYTNYFLTGLNVDFSKTDEYVKSLLAMYPHDKRINAFAATHFQYMNKDLKAAEPFFQKAVAIDKEWAPIQNLLGYFHMDEGNYVQAEKAFTEYLGMLPGNPNPHDSYGDLLREMGRYDESNAQYQTALELDKQYTISIPKIGDNYFFKGDYVKAHEYYKLYFDKTISVAEKLDALKRKAIAYLYEGNPSAALKCFAESRAIASKEKQRARYLMDSYGSEIAILFEMDKPMEALKRYKESIAVLDKAGLHGKQKEDWRISGNSTQVRAFAETNQLAKAKASAALLEKDAAQNEELWIKNSLATALACIDFQEKNYDAAMARLAAVKQNSAALFQQGRACLLKGDRERAKEFFKQMVEKNQRTFGQALYWHRAHEELKKLGE